MKKVLAIMGSPRKLETYKIVQQFERELKSHGQVEFKYLYLKDVHLETCKGCFRCLEDGEQLCPLKDDRDAIFQQIMEADGVIFASPVYSLQVTALMKNLLDRLAYIFHRPCFHGKTSIAIITQGVYGGKNVIKYLNEVAHFWGFLTTHGVGVTTPPGVRLPAEQKKIDDAVAKGAAAFYRNLTRVQAVKPRLMDVIMFRMIRTLKPYTSDIMPRDYEYFKERGWMDAEYFYPVRLGVLKTLIGKFMDGQGRKMGEKMRREHEAYAKHQKA